MKFDIRERYGRFEVLETIGTGGQGCVVRARDTQHDRMVALKIRPAAATDDREALLGEARVLLDLRPHPGLPYVRDDFFEGEDYVIVMDWIDGTDLKTLVTRQGDPGLPIQSVLKYLTEVAGALDHLHRHHPPVMHGDVKPANCVLTADGRVVLVDFGIATGASGAHTPGAGTRGYLAPEVAGGQPPHPASDVYGLAATAFTLLTGIVPDNEWPEFEGVAPAEAQTLARAIRLGLSTDPKRRPHSAAELVDRMRAWRDTALPSGVITFLMTDVEGSTSMWERTPDGAARAIAQHEALIADAVESTGGKLIKSRGEGDSTTSVFVKASDAVVAAIAVQRSMLAERWPADASVRVRIAIHTGEAQLRDGDYYGTTPNRAARLKSFADGGQIVLSQTTAAVVTDTLPSDNELVDLGPQELRGSARPERVYRLHHPDLTQTTILVERPAGVPDIPLPSWLDVATSEPFAGREAEISGLAEARQRATAGSPVVTMLVGEPGIGKTRLAGEIAIRARDDGALVVGGRCFEDSLVPYQPFAELLRAYVDAVPPALIAARLGRHATQLGVVVPSLAGEVPNHPGALAHAENERYLFFDAVATALVGLAESAPLVVVLDDLQWADTATLLLLRHVLRAAETAPLLVVGTYRDTDAPAPARIADLAAELSRSFDVRTIELGGLDSTDVGALVSERSGRSDDERLTQAVWRETDGNPLFVEELVRHLIETGRIDDTMHPNEGFGLPDNVRDLISRRLSRLTSGARTVLTYGAVLGFDFTIGDLKAVCDLSADEMTNALDETIGARLLVEAHDIAGAYRFAHAVARSALVDSMTRTRRAALHEQIGLALEAAGRSDDATLAHHFSQAAGADNLERAVSYGRAAGDRARAQLAYDEAAIQYGRSLGALDQLAPGGRLEERCQLLSAVGGALYDAGARDEAKSTFLAAAEIARGLSADLLAEAALGVGGPAWGTLGQTDDALVALIEEALQRLGAEPAVLRVRLLARLAMEFTLASATKDRVDELSRQAVSAARTLGEPSALVYALISRSWCVWGPGAWMERLDCANEVMRIAPVAGHYDLVREARQARLLAFLQSGDIASLDAELESEARLAEELKLPLFRATVIQDQAMRALMRGHFEIAETLANASLEEGGQDDNVVLGYGAQLLAIRWDQDREGEMIDLIQQVVDDNPYLASFRCALALAYSECGRADDARAELVRIQETGLQSLDVDTLTLSLAVLAVTIDNLGLEAPARAVYPLLAPYTDEIVNARLAVCWGSMHRYLGLLAKTMCDVEKAEQHFRDALHVHERMRAEPWIAHSLADLGSLLCAHGDPDEGRPMLVRATEIAERLQMARLSRHLTQVGSAQTG